MPRWAEVASGGLRANKDKTPVGEVHGMGLLGLLSGMKFVVTGLVLLAGARRRCLRVSPTGRSHVTIGRCADGDGSIRFGDVAQDVGLTFEHGAFQTGPSADPVAMMGGGLCWIDVDRDGWLDLFVVNSFTDTEAEPSGRPVNCPAPFSSATRGEFHDFSTESGLNAATRANGCVATDLDNDGWTDLYVTSDRGNLLFWNNGDGTFSEGRPNLGSTHTPYANAGIPTRTAC